MSEISKGYFIDKINLKYNPECYLECLSTLFDLNHYDGFGLVNHFLGFCLSKRGEGRNHFSVYPFANNEIEDSIYKLSEIEISKVQESNWDKYLSNLAASLKNGQPVIAMIDTFFTEFFPKKNGHNVHTLLVYGIDNENVYVKSAAPGDWTIPLENFRMASNSSNNKFSLRNQSLLIKFNGHNKSFSVADALKENFFMMAEFRPENGVLYGLNALDQFRIAFLEQIDSLDFSSFDDFFKQFTFVSQQRSRYHSFLNRYFRQHQNLLRTYENLSSSWEIFRNMYFKIRNNPNPDFRRRLAVKIDAIVDLEYSGVQALKNYLASNLAAHV